MPVISIKDAAAYYAKDGPLAKQMQAAALKGLYSAVLRGKQLLVTREIPSKTPPPVDKGIYKAGWQVEKLPKGAALYNAVPYAAAIEEGVPGANVVLSYKFQTMLAEWVRRKVGGSRKPPTVEKQRAMSVRLLVAKERFAKSQATWKERTKKATLKGKPAPKAPKLPPIMMHSNRARIGADYGAAWETAGAIMHALKKRGIFNRGRGLQVLSMFAKNSMPAVIREEVEKAMQKAVGK